MRRRLLIGAAIALAALAIVVWAAIGPLLSPRFKQNVLDVLGQHFGGNAELRSLYVSFFPWPQVVGEGLVLRHRGRTDIPPLLAIEKFSASAGWIGMLKRPRRVDFIELSGLRLHIPARQPGESLIPDGLQSPARPQTGAGAGEAKTPVIIDRVHSSDARLEIAVRKPGRPPRTFEIHRLDMTAIALDRPMQFRASLTNYKPPGHIESKGEFGPWVAAEPGVTPLRGGYTFAKADLGVFKGIDGTLDSEGTFSGILERIGVRGVTSTPDFMVKLAGNRVALSTSFQAVVDGTNGDTWLDPVDAKFLDSALTARGGIVRVEGVKGREISLDVSIEKARIEDLLRLAMKGENPFMTGAAVVKTKLHIPPGDVDVIDKLELDGEFKLASARFSDVDVQRSLARLSRNARGLPGAERGPSVVSGLTGRFVLRDGRLKFSKLTFSIPGANVQLAGAYSIPTEQLAFRGTLQLQATISQTQTGVKRVLLKMIDPFFRKQGHGAVIPIKIEGDRTHPKFGLDMGALLPGDN
jgi:hypothetical protein